ncbi:MAG: DUF1565 domain-containing protein, partial [Candidatus Dadabacteria bacterium]
MNRFLAAAIAALSLPGCFEDVIDSVQNQVENAVTGLACQVAASMPADLGIRNDDDQWLCDQRPQAPKTLDGIVRAAGVTLCYTGERGQVTGNDIYVSPTGNDDFSGAAPEQALRTLTEAMCRVRPGQTIHLAPGTYNDAVLLGLSNKADDAPVTITGTGARPDDVILDGEYWRSFAIGLVETHNVVIANLTVQHYTDTGIYT